MAESTLALSYDELRSEVGAYLGYGRDVTAWDEDADLTAAANAARQKKRETVESIVKSGLARFYHPGNYEWSFLRPTRELTLKDNQADTDLPADFGGLDGPLYFHGDEQRSGAGIPIVGDGEIRKQRQDSPDSEGTPQLACIRPKTGVGALTGQRWQLCVWPKPDADYTLVIRYFVLPDALTAANAYPLGGAQHRETILEACLAVAEERLDNVMNGPHGQRFAERLAASNTLDRRNKPHAFGRYGNRGEDYSLRDLRADTIVTVNGVTYLQ